MKQITILLIVALIGIVYSHTYITSPVPREGAGVATQVAPCGPYPFGTNLQTAAAGDFISISWENRGHPSPPNAVSFSNFTMSSNINATTQSDFLVGSTVLATNVPYADPYAVLRIPPGTTPGMYTVQLMWSLFTPYYVSCVDYNVTANPNPNINIIAPGEQVQVTMSNNNPTKLYEIAPDTSSATQTTQFLAFTASVAFGTAHILVKSFSIPTLTNSDFNANLTSISKNKVSASFCTDKGTSITPETLFVSVSGDASTIADVEFYSYTAALPYSATGSTVINDNINTTIKYFYVDAWSTYDTPKRVVLRSSSLLLFSSSTNCQPGNSVVTTTPDVPACIDLAYNANYRKYISVQSPTNDADFQISLEHQTCEMLYNSSSSIVSVSFALLTVVFTFLMFF